MTKPQFIRPILASIFFTLIGLPLNSSASEPVPVVATFSILGDMIARIGGEEISLSTLVGAGGDPHVYQPTPADARSVKEAEILFINGLEFEGWLERLVEAAEFGGQTVIATRGINLISLNEHSDEHGDEHAHHHGEFDPHGWQSLDNAIVYVDNITAELSKAIPKKASVFYSNRAAYLAEIKALDAEIRAMMAKLPDSSRTIITSHDAFQYFGREYGLKFSAPQGLGTDSEASAKDVARLISQIREEKIGAVFVENIADPRLLEQIANETGADIGGKLYPGSLSDQTGPAATYLELMRHNAMTISEALGG
jgi:zinc/manganese transport system substrate-binding protein